MNLATFVVGTVVVLVVALAVKSLYHDRKKGGGCGGNCSGCSGCH